MGTLFLERNFSPLDILVKNFFQQEQEEFTTPNNRIINHPVDIYEDKTGLYFDIACTGLTKKQVKVDIEGDVLRVSYTKKDKDLRLLAYQILVDKFNKKYKTLNESQKSLLKHYINNISNTNSLREFVDSEVIKIKKTLNVHLPKVTDEITKIKLTEAVNQIGNLTKGRVVDEKQVLTLMRYYELVKEIENVHKS